MPGAVGDAFNEPMQSCFNVEQLEDVDMVNEDDDADAILQRIDGETLKCAVKVSFSERSACPWYLDVLF